jgi:GTP-binding protein
LARKRLLVDEAKIFVRAGDGGKGSVSFRREKFVARGGPDGGDGGRGGHIYLLTDPKKRTLVEFLDRVHFRSESGSHGSGNNRHGRRGLDLTIRIPVGTVVWDEQAGGMLADLAAAGVQCLVARGGSGGRGNARFATSRYQAPRFAEKGEPGQQLWLRLELKLLSDVGLVGMPNAGKSSLLARVSAARPRIADYPFTTLEPVLGMVRPDEDRSFVLADLPGLIEGSHTGHGLGHEFLRHVERTRLILHVLDLASDRDPVSDFDTINRELFLHSPALAEAPQVVAANKIDLPFARERLPAVRDELRKRGLEVFAISAVTGEGVQLLIYHVAGRLEALSAPVEQEPVEASTDSAELTPPEAAKAEAAPSLAGRQKRRKRSEGPPVISPFKIEPTRVECISAGLFRVAGTGVERMAVKLDKSNAEALTRFHRSLERMGIIRELKAKGAREGDKVLIGKEEFDFLEEE